MYISLGYVYSAKCNDVTVVECDAAVENDPHFVISVAGLKEAVCFDVNGRPDSVYQLLHDKLTGADRFSRCT